MEPRFMEGDVIIVDPASRVEAGDLCIVKINEEMAFKILREKNGAFRLAAMNDKYPDILIKKKSRVHFKIIGKVVDMVPKLY